MKEIGGFFEIELNAGKEYHNNAIKLNSGRNALWYYLKVKKPKKIYIPYYSCNCIVDPIDKEKISIVFYHINEFFEPLIDIKEISSDAILLYVNYYGINDEIVETVVKRYKDVIIDNSQSFFSKPIEGTSTFYSPRKFFGVSDGGYLYSDILLEEQLAKDISFARYEHLLKRADVSAQESYRFFQQNEDSLIGQPIRQMSNLTQKILSSIDYEKASIIRQRNFLYLHNYLAKFNEINLSDKDIQYPMVYPFLIPKDGLRDFLITKRIYVATYWKEVLEIVPENSIEHYFTKYLIPLPVDHRYGITDMRRIIDMILSFI